MLGFSKTLDYSIENIYRELISTTSEFFKSVIGLKVRLHYTLSFIFNSESLIFWRPTINVIMFSDIKANAMFLKTLIYYLEFSITLFIIS